MRRSYAMVLCLCALLMAVPAMAKEKRLHRQPDRDGRRGAPAEQYPEKSVRQRMNAGGPEPDVERRSGEKGGTQDARKCDLAIGHSARAEDHERGRHPRSGDQPDRRQHAIRHVNSDHIHRGLT